MEHLPPEADVNQVKEHREHLTDQECPFEGHSECETQRYEHDVVDRSECYAEVDCVFQVQTLMKQTLFRLFVNHLDCDILFNVLKVDSASSLQSTFRL